MYLFISFIHHFSLGIYSGHCIDVSILDIQGTIVSKMSLFHDSCILEKEEIMKFVGKQIKKNILIEVPQTQKIKFSMLSLSLKWILLSNLHFVYLS